LVHKEKRKERIEKEKEKETVYILTNTAYLVPKLSLSGLTAIQEHDYTPYLCPIVFLLC
jgi:hypothetical protein